MLCKIKMTTIYIILTIVGVIAILALYFYVRHFVPLRSKEQGFEYVQVEEDGTVRELDEEEREYLNTEFHGADGASPYIKSRYDQLTPDKKLWGYLPRRRVPKRIKIKPITEK